MSIQENVVYEIWHDLVEDWFEKDTKPDKQYWEYVAGIYNLNNEEKLSLEEIKKYFEQYFLELCGIKPYKKCPACGEGITRPRQSHFGKYFIGCSRFPKCRFTATDRKPVLLARRTPIG
jgi:ssDNA-binding Zn-finger/Zn-ribbon topoisomerase 1